MFLKRILNLSLSTNNLLIKLFDKIDEYMACRIALLLEGYKNQIYNLKPPLIYLENHQIHNHIVILKINYGNCMLPIVTTKQYHN